MKPESKTYRHADNPEEKRFHDAAINMGTRMLSAITLPLNDGGTEPSRNLTQDEDLLKYWDDAYDIDVEDREEIVFTSRFPKPNYFVES